MSDNNRIERASDGAIIKNFKIAMDISALPSKMSPDMFVKLADGGFIFYDSSKGNRPKLYQVGESNDETVPAFVDTKGKEVDIDLFLKEAEDQEYWRKELYKCKQSPLYYFVNFVSAEPKPSQKQIDEFLDLHGFLGDEDSDNATVVKEVRDKFSATVTLENLKNMKPVRDRIDAEYETITEELCEKAAKVFHCTKTHTKRIEERCVSAIMKIKPKDAPDHLKHYIIEASGRWDKSLFRATDFDVIIRMWDSISK